MVAFIHDLIKSSHQIVHNRGKALAYLSGKNREGPVSRKAPHKYDVRVDPSQRRGAAASSTNYSDASESYQQPASRRMPPQPNYHYVASDAAAQQ